jgi:hypothetical protein
MCLITITPEVLIAEEDISVFKLIRIIKEHSVITTYISSVARFEYTKGLTYELGNSLIVDKYDNRFFPFDEVDGAEFRRLINEYVLSYQSYKSYISCVKLGFNFAFNKERLLPYEFGGLRPRKVLEFIIPAGAKYIKGITELGISDKIIFPF